MSDGVAVRQSGIENYLDAAGSIDLPPGTTLLSNFERNIAEFATTAAYRYLDFTRDDDGVAIELSWDALNTRMRAIGARLQQVTARGDRVAILAPQGLDYVIGFFAAIQAGNIAVPLFAPELPGHTERLDAVLADATPSVILTTDAAAESVNAFLRKLPRQRRPRVIAIDAVPDSVGATFTPAELDTDDLAYLQYTSGSTRTPAGVEITHRAACTNVLQMILAGGLDMDIRSVSWLPLYHDMGLIMILFPPLCGGHITLMSPLAFVRRPRRWVKQLAAESAYGRVFAAAPNFAFELAAQRGLPPAGETWDLSNVAGLLNGSEPVTISAIEKFTEAFAPYGFPASAIKPSYGMAEATLSVATIGIHDRPSVIHLDREQLADDRAVPVSADAPTAVPHVSCGQVISSQWLVIVDPQTGTELPEGESARSGFMATTSAGATGAAAARPRQRSTTGCTHDSHRQATRSEPPKTANGCAPGISGCISTTICMSPAASRTSSSSTGATTTRRTSRRRPQPPPPPSGRGMSPRSPSPPTSSRKPPSPTSASAW